MRRGVRRFLQQAMRASRAIFCMLMAQAGALAAGAPGHPSNWALWLDVRRDPVASAELVLPDPKAIAADPEWLERWGRTPPSIAWSDIAIELVVKYQQNPLRAARMLALVHAAIHDAVVLCAREQCDQAATRIAMHGAAGHVLAHMYPQESPGRFEALARSAALASVVAHGGGEGKPDRAWKLGMASAQAAIARALDDGADRPRILAARPADAPGVWRAAPPLNIYDPAEPRAGEWRTWVLASGSELEPPPPLKFGSPEYWAEVEEVRRVAASLTPAQKKISEDWNLDLGSVTPAGVWNLHARRLALEQRLDTARAAQLFAALNTAMVDAFVACWHAKYKWWTQRPVSAIREKFDPGFLPPIVTPPFPGYVSGHATASGAASVVLAAFFSAQAAELTRMAEEAAVSRLYGGIHFTSDNAAGLELGRRIGERTVARLSTR